MRYESLGAILAIAIVSSVAHSCGVDLETATRAALRFVLRH